MTFYSAAQPTSLKTSYGANDIIDFQVQPGLGRSIVPGSFRFSGQIATQVLKPNGTWRAINSKDYLQVDAFAGIHSIVRSINTQVNSRTIENTQLYPRVVSMMRQATNTLNSLNTDSTLISEICGTVNNFQLIGTVHTEDMPSSTAFLSSFSMLPMNCLNMASGQLSQKKFQNIQMSFTLADALEIFYTSRKPEDNYMLDDETGYTSVRYAIFNPQLDWVEVAGTTSETVVLPVKELFQQTISSQSSYLNITCPALYNAVSMSFLAQEKQNSLFHNNNLCEKIYGIDSIADGESGDARGSVEILINANDTVIPYPIQTYQEIAINYLKSLNGNSNKNVILNQSLSNVLSFGIGFAMLTSSFDRVAVNLKIDATAYKDRLIPQTDAFIYTNSFVQI